MACNRALSLPSNPTKMATILPTYCTGWRGPLPQNLSHAPAHSPWLFSQPNVTEAKHSGKFGGGGWGARKKNLGDFLSFFCCSPLSVNPLYPQAKLQLTPLCMGFARLKNPKAHTTVDPSQRRRPQQSKALARRTENHRTIRPTPLLETMPRRSYNVTSINITGDDELALCLHYPAKTPHVQNQKLPPPHFSISKHRYIKVQ